jgi:hypothetical protein
MKIWTRSQTCREEGWQRKATCRQLVEIILWSKQECVKTLFQNETVIVTLVLTRSYVLFSAGERVDLHNVSHLDNAHARNRHRELLMPDQNYSYVLLEQHADKNDTRLTARQFPCTVLNSAGKQNFEGN